MLMSCWFERHVSFWSGGEKTQCGAGKKPAAPPPPRCPPPGTWGLSTYPVVAHLAGTGGLQAHAVDIVPGEGHTGVTTLQDSQL